MPPPPDNADPSPAREEARRNYLAACAASPGSPPPVETFVAALGEPDRSLLRAELEALRAHLAGGATVDGPGTPPAAEPDPGTITFEGEPAPAAPGQETTEEGPTVDHAPPANGTVDHVPARGATTDDAGGSGGTVDHAPPPGKASAGSAVPRTVAGYEILGVLGRGGMGVVYKARQRGLKRLVALKMILSGDHASEHDLGRFRSEAEAVARLQHPGIVQIYEVGEDAGRPFFSLEFIDGESLDRKLRGTPLPAREAAGLVRQMAEAMDYAHQAGVVHRDLKPANVLLTAAGVPKVGDFGLAKRLQDEESGLTRTGTVLGTPSYMAPEQAEGRTHEVGALADVYSLGAVLYECLTGRPPFRGPTIYHTLQQLRTTEPVPPTRLQPGVPRDVETICLKCLQKDRAKRYASAGELAADLGRFLGNEPIQARPVGGVERAWRWCRRNPRQAALLGVALALLLGWAGTASGMAVLLKLKMDEAVEAQRKEEEARIAADKSAKEALAQKQVAEEKKQVALDIGERQRGTAENAMQSLILVTKGVLRRLPSKRKAQLTQAEIQKLRADVLAEMRGQMGELKKRVQATAQETFARVAGDTLLADLLRSLGQTREAHQLDLLAHRSAQARAEKEPANDRARANLGVLELRLGEALMDMEGGARGAYEHFRTARRLHEQVLRAPRDMPYKPLDARQMISHDDFHLATALLALGRPAEARGYLEQSLRYREEYAKAQADPDGSLTWTAQSRMLLIAAAARLGDRQAVQEHYHKAAALYDRLLKKYPASVVLWNDLAEVLGHYGDALLRLGPPGEAEKPYQQSLRALEKALAGYPDDLERQQLLALTYERLGHAAALRGQPAEAKQWFDKALPLRLEQYLLDRGNLSRKAALVLAWARAGKHADASSNAARIRPALARSPPLMLQLARAYAACSAVNAGGRDRRLADALSALKQAVGDDFKDASGLATDPDLRPLREHSAFKALLEQVKAR
jgi:serine/threonine-protein kinase